MTQPETNLRLCYGDAERVDEMQGSLEKFARLLGTLGEPSLLEDEMAEKFTEAVEAAAAVLDSQFPAVAAVVMHRE